MSDFTILLDDDEKTVYELFYTPGAMASWIHLTGNPAGWGCLSGFNESGELIMSHLYHGFWADDYVRLFAIVPKQRIRQYEIYAICFLKTVNGTVCYAEGYPTIQLQEILDRFPDLYCVKEFTKLAKQFAVPALMMPRPDVESWLKNTQPMVLNRLTQKMNDQAVFGNLHRLSLYQWTIGIENKEDQRAWVVLGLFWSKIKGNNDFLKQVIACQQDFMASDVNDRTTAILNKVLTPLCIEYKINRIAEKTNTVDQLLVLKSWTAEKLKQLTTESYKEIISEQHN
jgi:hypothetical protein